MQPRNRTFRPRWQPSKRWRDAAKNDGWMTPDIQLDEFDSKDPGDIATSHREAWEQTCHWEHFYGNEISRICDKQELRFGGNLGFEQRYYGLYGTGRQRQS